MRFDAHLRWILRFNVIEITFDLIMLIYSRVFLVKILSGKIDLPNVVSPTMAVLGMILILLFLPWYLILMIKSYHIDIPFIRGVISFYFLCVILVMFIMGPVFFDWVYEMNEEVFVSHYLFWGPFAIAAGIFLGISTPAIRRRILHVISDDAFWRSFAFSLELIFTAAVVVLMCLYDQLVLVMYVKKSQEVSIGGMILFTFLSGLVPLRIAVMFNWPIRLVNIVTGMLVIAFYFVSVLSAVVRAS